MQLHILLHWGLFLNKSFMGGRTQYFLHYFFVSTYLPNMRAMVLYFEFWAFVNAYLDSQSYLEFFLEWMMFVYLLFCKFCANNYKKRICTQINTVYHLCRQIWVWLSLSNSMIVYEWISEWQFGHVVCLRARAVGTSRPRSALAPRNSTHDAARPGRRPAPCLTEIFTYTQPFLWLWYRSPIITHLVCNTLFVCTWTNIQKLKIFYFQFHQI